MTDPVPRCDHAEGRGCYVLHGEHRVCSCRCHARWTDFCRVWRLIGKLLRATPTDDECRELLARAGWTVNW